MNAQQKRFFQAMPTFDGHFWVEKDGVIIDCDFPKDDAFIRKINKTTSEKKYHEAPEITQTIFIGMLEKALTFELQKMKMMGHASAMAIDTRTIFGMMEKADNEAELKEYQPRFESCHLNAYKNWKEHGGRLVFGSQGYVKKDGTGVWWEYGNPEWTKVVQFTK
jgi:hypothetical protein